MVFLNELRDQIPIEAVIKSTTKLIYFPFFGANSCDDVLRQCIENVMKSGITMNSSKINSANNNVRPLSHHNFYRQTNAALRNIIMESLYYAHLRFPIHIRFQCNCILVFIFTCILSATPTHCMRPGLFFCTRCSHANGIYLKWITLLLNRNNFSFLQKYIWCGFTFDTNEYYVYLHEFAIASMIFLVFFISVYSVKEWNGACVWTI